MTLRTAADYVDSLVSTDLLAVGARFAARHGRGLTGDGIRIDVGPTGEVNAPFEVSELAQL